MRNWVSKLILKRIPLAGNSDHREDPKGARTQARRQELLIAYDRVRSAVQYLAIQKANALTLANEIREEFGATAAKQLFPEMGFPLRTSPDRWIRSIEDQILTSMGSLPNGPIVTGDKPLKEMMETNSGPSFSTRRKAMRKPCNPDLLTAEQACELFGGITRAGLYDGMNDGRFPKPIKIGPKTARWLRSECDAVLLRRAQERT